MSSCIRIATTDDAAQVAEIYAPSVAETSTSFELTPPDAAEMARRIQSTLTKYPWLVYEDHGRVLGYAYGCTHRERAAYRWSVEVSAYVHRDAHRRGIGKALYLALFEILALQGFRTAFAGITLPNAASVALHKSVGFVPIGEFHKIGYKQGAWHDVGWFERPLSDHVSEPPEPKPFSEIRERGLTL